MNRNDLAVQMIKDSSVTQTDAQKVIGFFIDVVTEELNKEDGKITLVGFGTFKSVTKKEKKGRNPRTGETIVIPRKKVVKFLPGKKLKELVK